MKRKIIFLFFAFFISACGYSSKLDVNQTFTAAVSLTPSSTPTSTNTPAPTSTITPTPTLTFPVTFGTAIPQPLSEINLANINQLKELARFQMSEMETYFDFEYSSDGARLIGISPQRFGIPTRLCTYDPVTKTSPTLIDHGIFQYDARDGSFIVSPNFTFLAVIKKTEVELWRINDGILLNTFILEEEPYSVYDTLFFSPDEQSLMMNTRFPSGDNTYLWRISDGSLLVQTSETIAVFSPDGKTLATGGISTPIKLWRTSDGDLISTFTGPNRLTQLAFSPNGQILAAVYDKVVQLWNISNGEVLKQLYGKNGLNKGNGDLSYSKDGQLLFVGAHDVKTLRVWQISDEKLLISLRNQFDPILSPDGTKLATISAEQVNFPFWTYHLALWDLSSQRNIAKVSSGYLEALQFSPDGSVLVVEDHGYPMFDPEKQNVSILNTSDGSLIQSFRGERNPFFLFNSGILVTFTFTGEINLRNISDGSIIRTLPGQAAASLPENNIFVTLDNGIIQLWGILP